MMVIPDTNYMTLLEHAESPLAAKVHERLRRLSPLDIATTIITCEEQVRGWLSILRSKYKITDQIEGYRRLQRMLVMYCRVNILEFDEHAAVTFQRLRKEHRRLGQMDLKIAAIVLEHNAMLLTQNIGDFRRIDGLHIEDWTREINL